jgi:hypothetical protein
LRKDYFQSPECNGCQFKASSYCWGQCGINVWKRQNNNW